MSNGIEFFFEGSRVRPVALILGVWWFVASDVTDVLGYPDAQHALRGLDDDEKQIAPVDRHNMAISRRPLLISESGVYHLSFMSRKPNAVRFRRWVTGEVLPTLRRQGWYVMPGVKPPSWRSVKSEMLALTTKIYDDAKSKGETLPEKQLGICVVDVTLAEHREWVPQLLWWAWHKKLFGPFQRQLNGEVKEAHPDQLELPGTLTVRTDDGYDRAIPLDEVTREQTGWWLRKQVLTAQGMRNVAMGIFRSCRAVVRHQSLTRPHESLTEAELTEISSELLEE